MTANDDRPQGQVPPGYRPLAPGEALPVEPTGPFTPGTAGTISDVGPREARELMSKAAVRYVAARLDGKRVAKYATLMLLGTWQPSTNPIPLTDDDRLVDGLNRLAAIVLSGTTQRMIIARTGGAEGQLPEFHQGPRLCDIEPLPEDHPDRNAF